MIITYQGGESFKISQGELTLAVNPQSARGSADVTLISSSAFKSDGKGFVIDGPGEYEVKGIGVKGFLSESGSLINTIYMISFENMNLCFLGALSNPALPAATLENLEDIDILFVPLAEGTLDAAAAYKLAVSLEPSAIIPMDHTKDALAKFLKEAGSEKTEALEKLVVKKKDLDGKEAEVIVLKEE